MFQLALVELINYNLMVKNNCMLSILKNLTNDKIYRDLGHFRYDIMKKKSMGRSVGTSPLRIIVNRAKFYFTKGFHCAQG